MRDARQARTRDFARHVPEGEGLRWTTSRPIRRPKLPSGGVLIAISTCCFGPNSTPVWRTIRHSAPLSGIGLSVFTDPCECQPPAIQYFESSGPFWTQSKGLSPPGFKNFGKPRLIKTVVEMGDFQLDIGRSSVLANNLFTRFRPDLRRGIFEPTGLSIRLHLSAGRGPSLKQAGGFPSSLKINCVCSYRRIKLHPGSVGSGCRMTSAKTHARVFDACDRDGSPMLDRLPARCPENPTARL